jgi:hypothetical protein
MDRIRNVVWFRNLCAVWGSYGCFVRVLYIPSISDSSCTRTLMKIREEEVVSVSLSLTYSKHVQGSPSVTERTGEEEKVQERAEQNSETELK